MADLIVGAWRNGLPREQAQMLEEVEGRERQGFRQLPSEAFHRDLARLLDAYDEVVEELLLDEGCVCVQEETVI